MSRPASPSAAVLLSGLMSGLGHLRSGAVVAGAALLFLEIAGWASFVAWAAYPEAGTEWAGLILVLLVVLRLASLVSAGKAVRKRSGRRGGIGAMVLAFFVVPVLFLAQAFGFLRFVLPLFVPLYGIPTSAMEPTLMGRAGDRHPAEACDFAAAHRPPTGDHILVSRMDYWWGPIRRFDVVVFRFPLDSKKSFVKRVVGLPGEELMLREGELHVRPPGRPGFEVVPKPPALEDLSFRPAPGYRPDAWGEGKAITVPADSYLMLGDNWRNSHDGRTWVRCVYEMKDGSRIECEAQSVETSLLRIKEITERRGLKRPPDVVIHSDRESEQRLLYREDIKEEHREAYRFVHRGYVVGRVVKVWWPSARAGPVR